MKKYFVIGNPIEHSLSPKLHNHWIKQNNINALYEKKEINKDVKNNIKDLINYIKNEKIHGINVTTPFKKSVIPFLDRLTTVASKAWSVNTIYKRNNEVIGDNTDVGGFELALKHINYSVRNKKIFILGAGGVVPSIILALKKLGAAEINLSNRTKEKAENLKLNFSYLKITNWGQVTDFDMIINATSLGLKKEDKIEIDFSKIGTNKLFYDVIYNPSKTNFLLDGKKTGNKIENGRMMFIYQAQLSFQIWHGIWPKINNKLLD